MQKSILIGDSRSAYATKYNYKKHKRSQNILKSKTMSNKFKY